MPVERAVNERGGGGRRGRGEEAAEGVLVFNERAASAFPIS